jgi:polar amino acid transport system substrate-binding protein
VLLALAGCGGGRSASTPTTPTTIPPASVNAAIAAKVPGAFKTKGTLNVGSEAQYAPNEFIAPDGHTVIGMDADLVHELATVMGLKANIINSNFETIIPGIQAGRYDLGASSFTDTREREKAVDFVTYFSAGVSFFAKSTVNPHVKTLADLCGKTVAVQKGTVEEEGAREQSEKCTKERKKSVTVLSFPGQNPVSLAVAGARAEVGMAEAPVVAFQIKQSNGGFKLIGESYDFKPYGFAIAKKSGLARPLLEAVHLLMSNGTYSAILAKWGVSAGAISDAKINGAVSQT